MRTHELLKLAQRVRVFLLQESQGAVGDGHCRHFLLDAAGVQPQVAQLFQPTRKELVGATFAEGLEDVLEVQLQELRFEDG